MVQTLEESFHLSLRLLCVGRCHGRDADYKWEELGVETCGLHLPVSTWEGGWLGWLLPVPASWVIYTPWQLDDKSTHCHCYLIHSLTGRRQQALAGLGRLG